MTSITFREYEIKKIPSIVYGLESWVIIIDDLVEWLLVAFVDLQCEFDEWLYVYR
jgi:hypothetical protein